MREDESRVGFGEGRGAGLGVASAGEGRRGEGLGAGGAGEGVVAIGAGGVRGAANLAAGVVARLGELVAFPTLDVGAMRGVQRAERVSWDARTRARRASAEARASARARIDAEALASARANVARLVNAADVPDSVAVVAVAGRAGGDADDDATIGARRSAGRKDDASRGEDDAAGGAARDDASPSAMPTARPVVLGRRKPRIVAESRPARAERTRVTHAGIRRNESQDLGVTGASMLDRPRRRFPRKVASLDAGRP